LIALREVVKVAGEMNGHNIVEWITDSTAKSDTLRFTIGDHLVERWNGELKEGRLNCFIAVA
jgi:hypothetical protein